MHILCLGDSYTIGEGVAPEERWPVQLAAYLRAHGLAVQDPQIIARTGWTTGELSAALTSSAALASRAALDTRAMPGPYDLVTLLIGVNNQYRGLAVAAYCTEFGALLALAIRLAGSRPQRVVVVSIPDWGVAPFAEGRDRRQIAEQIDAFNQANQAESRAAGARYVDITPLSRQLHTPGVDFAPDGLHPSGQMYAAWVQQIGPVALGALGA